MAKGLHPNEIEKLQRNSRNIRNISILAHVDHGKTTFADNLIASNEIIPKSMVGEMRYMDSRSDEQERGITMKSSSISLKYEHNEESYLINIVDSPGHVDFSQEVSCAVYLTDGAIILIDAVEGPHCQTNTVVRQALQEDISMILVINKIDRLFTHLGLSPHEAFQEVLKIVEKANTIVAEFQIIQSVSIGSSTHEEIHSSVYFDPVKRKNVLFCSSIDGWAFDLATFANFISHKLKVSPSFLMEKLWGNYYYDMKLKLICEGACEKNKPTLFSQFVFGTIFEVYNNFKTNSTCDGERKKRIIRSLFTSKFGYNLDDSHLAAMERFIEEVVDRNHVINKPSKILSVFMPLSDCVLRTVCCILPSPLYAISPSRLNCLYPYDDMILQSPQMQKIMTSITSCDSSSDVPVVIQVAKNSLFDYSGLVYSIHQNININKKSNTNESNEVKSQRYQRIFKHFDSLNSSGDKNMLLGFSRVYSGTLSLDTKLYFCESENLLSQNKSLDKIDHGDSSVDGSVQNYSMSTYEITSNCIDLLKLEDPEKVEENREKSKEEDFQVVRIVSLFLMMGSRLEPIEFVPAGNVCAIQFSHSQPIKAATLCSIPNIPEISLQRRFKNSGSPLRVAIEPIKFNDMQCLSNALRKVSLSDPGLRVIIEETGEYVLEVSGKVHLERCLTDIKTFLNDGIEFEISTVLVPFRECIAQTDFSVDESKITTEIINSILPMYLQRFMDGVNIIPSKPTNITTNEVSSYLLNLADDQPLSTNHFTNIQHFASLLDNLPEYKSAPLVTVNVTEWDIVINIKCLPLPSLLTQAFIRNSLRIKKVCCHNSCDSDLSAIDLELLKDRENLLSNFQNCIIEQLNDQPLLKSFWLEILNRIWTFGPNGYGCNVLVDVIDCIQFKETEPNEMYDHYLLPLIDYIFPSESKKSVKIQNSENECNFLNKTIQHSIMSGFQLATFSGPLTEEPMMGICFVIDSVVKSPHSAADRCEKSSRNAFSVASDVMKLCRAAYLSRIGYTRIGLLYDRCLVRVNSSFIGRVYQVLQKLHAIILEENNEAFNMIQITALVPVIHSFEFSSDLLNETCGYAVPEVSHHGWEILSEYNPFYVFHDPEDETEGSEASKRRLFLFDSILKASDNQKYEAKRVNLAYEYMIGVRKRKGLLLEEQVVVSAEKQRNLKRNK